MTLLFIHFYEKVKRDTEGNLYTDGSYSMKIWERYLAVFDHITLIMREDPVVYEPSEASVRFNIIDPARISFVPVKDTNDSLKSFVNLAKRFERRNIIKQYIDAAEAVIVRLPGTDWVINYANKKSKPCLVEVVGCPFDQLWNQCLSGKVLAIPSSLRLKHAMRGAKHTIYVTSEFLQKRYPTKGEQIGCSDVQTIAKNNVIFEQQNPCDKDVICLGTAGATDMKFKGQQYVIMALARLKKMSSKRFIYQIAGNGDTTYLQSQAKKYGVEDSVQFVGSIPHERMEDWYRGLDIYIQPSKTEGLPRALAEAMSVGTACIGSSAGGIPELLDQESIFRKGDVKDLANILVRFSDTTFRKEKVACCYHKSQEYREDILVKKRIDFMRKAFPEPQNN